MATLTGSHVKSPSHGSLGFELKFTEKTMCFFYGNLTSSNCKNVMIAFTTPRSPWAKSAGKTRYVFVGSIPIVLAGLVGRREVATVATVAT
jgi:hypothetical protein